jgi:UDP-N-acetylmuramate dehydrogenase
MFKLRENTSLKSFNTFGIDVRGRFLTEATDVETFSAILEDRQFAALPIMVLGGGSNVLFTGDYNGLIVLNRIKGIEVLREDAEHVFVRAAAGEVWHEFVMWCIERNYAGLENLSLIPGCVGAAPMQNIGAYGVEMKDCFHELEALNTESLTIEKFSNSDCHFGYRESVFKRELKGQYIITAVTFKLSKSPVFHTTYGAIQQELEKMHVETLSIRAISDAVISIRRSKLPDPKVLGNAGSFFKNPEITPLQKEALLSAYPDAVVYPLPNGNFKAAAGWLIEKAGWKGKRIEDYGVHTLQALVLVNYGGASGKQIWTLSQNIVDDIQQRFGIVLEREVNIV